MPTVQETIILLHGIGRTPRCFKTMQRALERSGYKGVAIGYPSRRYTIDACADYVAGILDQRGIWHAATKIHFVTHSMGGCVLDSYMRRHQNCMPLEKLGRVVMLAPPWGGSEIANFWSQLKLYHWIYGPAGRELTTPHRSFYTDPAPYPLAVIAGTRGWYYPDAWFLFHEKNDGRVSVARTYVPGMTQHLSLPVGHSGILGHPQVHQQTLHFLQTGQFADAPL